MASHPDDETLGVGATIHRLTQEQKCEAHALVLSRGWASREESNSSEINKNVANLERATSLLGYTHLEVADFPDNAFDTVPLLEIIKKIEEVASRFKPDIVFTHSGHDLNIDHRRCYEAVLTAFRPLPNSQVKSLFSFQTLSSTEYQSGNSSLPFFPNICLAISDDNLKHKLEAMKCYDSEFRDFPHPRSKEAIESDAKINGSKFGVNLAEVFQLIRHLS